MAMVLSPGGLSATAGLKEEQTPPRYKRPRQIQISCSPVFYGENETKFRRNLNTESNMLWRTNFIDLQRAVVPGSAS